MILVLLGTQNNSFERLLKKIDNLIENKIINDKVVAQVGYTKYSTNNIEMVDFISKEKLEKYVEESDFIITHGGVGSILLSLEKGKKVIAIPRLHKYKEHINDHQKEIIEVFNEKEYIIGIQDVEDLEDAIKRIKDFKPKKYKQDNSKMLKIIEDFIDKC